MTRTIRPIPLFVSATMFAGVVFPSVILPGVILPGIILPETAHASPTHSHVVQSESDFLDGTWQGAAITDQATLTWAPRLESTPVDAASTWALAIYEDPSTQKTTLLVGTGNDGQVKAVDMKNGSPDPKTWRTVLETHALAVTALLVTPDGTLFAGALPEGKLFKAPRNLWRTAGQSRGNRAPQAEEVQLPSDVEHIWDLAWDDAKQTLWIATGPTGKLLTLGTNGRIHTAIDTEDDHILSVVQCDGTTYLGTSNSAVVMKVNGSPRTGPRKRGSQPLVVHDFGDDEEDHHWEVTRLACASGHLFAVVNNMPDPPRAEENKSDKQTKTNTKNLEPGRGTLWWWDTNGRLERLLENDEEHFTALTTRIHNESLQALVGGGHLGHVYRAQGFETQGFETQGFETQGFETQRPVSTPNQPNTSMLFDAEARQVKAIASTANTLAALTNDSATLLYENKSPHRPRGSRKARRRNRRQNRSTHTWTSQTLDAEQSAAFGRVTWHADGPIRLSARSGNTESPDDRWSEWSEWKNEPHTPAVPLGRYLQLRVELQTEHSAVHDLHAFYRPQNQRARIHRIEIEAPEPEEDSKPAASAPNSTIYKLKWEVENPDEDPLRYRIRYRSALNPNVATTSPWLRIDQEQQPVTEHHFDWNTESIPDGEYLIAIEASDELTQPESRTLRSHTLSSPIRIDNHAPQIALRKRRDQITGTAQDSTSPIHRLQYAINGGAWRPLAPTDGILDSQQESFSFILPPGTHTATVRATDASGNQVAKAIR